MPHRIEYARRQALDAYAHASEAMDNVLKQEWLKAASLWEQLIQQYEMLLNTAGPETPAESE